MPSDPILIDRCPDDTPSFQGDPNENPNAAWWAGIWESIVQNRAAGEDAAPANPPVE